MDLTSLLLAVGATAGLLGLAVLGIAGLVLGFADLADQDLAGTPDPLVASAAVAR